MGVLSMCVAGCYQFKIHTVAEQADHDDTEDENSAAFNAQLNTKFRSVTHKKKNPSPKGGFGSK